MLKKKLNNIKEGIMDSVRNGALQAHMIVSTTISAMFGIVAFTINEKIQYALTVFATIEIASILLFFLVIIIFDD